MTLFEKYGRLNLDLSRLGLERGDACGGYFCDPLGAEVIGWAGVDGIHCCFVDGFGEMVFAVSPANGPGEYVHPLARSFEDFLRLILACGGVDAVEQAWMWNRGEFDAFLETYPPDGEQRAVLDALAQALSLTPMDDPYGYLKEVQSSFDYGKLKFGEEYYELAGEPEPEGPRSQPEWAVYYEGGFGRHWGRDRPGQEIPVNKTFTWGGKTWHIPAAYACGKGLVVDLCVEIDPGELGAFQEKWAWAEGDRPLTPEDEERREAENPMNVDYRPKVTVSGRALGGRSGCGSGWVPMYLRPEDCRGAYNQQDWESLRLMEHYGLDPEKGWMFWRDSFPWATRAKPVVKAITLSLEREPAAVPGPRFTVSGAGDRVDFANPITGQSHTLRVVAYEAQEMDMSDLPDLEGWDYPTQYTAIAYTVEPELPRKALTVQDVEHGDRPRPKPLDAIGGADGPAACSIGIIGGADGPTAILVACARGGLDSDPPQLRSACSALRFAPPERIQWRTVFRETAPDGVVVKLLP